MSCTSHEAFNSITKGLVKFVLAVWQHAIWTCGLCFWCGELSSSQLAAKHRLRTQNISSNFSETRFNTPWGCIPEDPKHVGVFVF